MAVNSEKPKSSSQSPVGVIGHIVTQPLADSQEDGTAESPIDLTGDDDPAVEEATMNTPDQRLSVFSNISHTLSSSLKWCPTSELELEKAESDLLSCLTSPFMQYFVDIGPGWGLESNKIRTLEILSVDEDAANKSKAKEAPASTAPVTTPTPSLNIDDNSTTIERDSSSPSSSTPEKKCPLVLVHGFAAGTGTWILNLDPLSQSLDRKIYAIDLIGFARSTRAPFNLNEDVEGQFIDSIERWRQKMGIEKFILLGHSFGGYLSASYALRHPDNVIHVILADPWGVQDRAASPNRNTYRFPIWVRVVNSIFQAFNPLAVLRASGPYGPSLVHKFRSDLREKFRPKLQDGCDKFLNYIYHCNAQSATGESAFKALALPYGWPKNPLIHRLLDLDERLSLTFIYGSRSWIEKQPGEFLRDCMAPNRVTVNEIEGSGHHVYADKYAEFNELVKEACSKVPT